MLTELETYRAIAPMEYRVEVTAPEHVAGSVTTIDGRQIFQFNSHVNGSVTIMVQETPERSKIFLTSFIKIICKLKNFLLAY